MRVHNKATKVFNFFLDSLPMLLVKRVQTL